MILNPALEMLILEYQIGRGLKNKMLIDYKFSIGQKVKIKELDHAGRVISVWSGRRGNEIQVKYCMNAKFEEVYFFEDELEEVKE